MENDFKTKWLDFVNKNPREDNIIRIALYCNFQKIIVKKDTWGMQGFARIDKIELKPDNRYGFCYGYIHYNNGQEYYGKIPNSGTYNWTLLDILDEKIELINL